MSTRGCFSLHFRRLVSQEPVAEYSKPLLGKHAMRKVKSGDDAMSVENIIVFNDTNLPVPSPLTTSYWDSQPHIQITSGENHISVGISPLFYEECQSRLEKCHDVSALYWEVRSLVPRFRGVSIENTSWTELSRSQVNKDIVRETLVVNGAVFQSGEDTHALKLFLLDKINAFSRGNLASLAIMRHLLTFFSRTESSGDCFSLLRDLFPRAVTMTTVVTAANPINVAISPSSHVTVDTYTILRVTREDTAPSLLSLVSKPLFTPHSASDADGSQSCFYVMHSIHPHFTYSCLLRCHLFYCTGDLQGVDVHRSMFMQVITSHRMKHVKSIDRLFDVPSPKPSSLFTPKPIYYEVDCREPTLHLTVSNEYDNEGREILVVTVKKEGRIEE
ncbi:hypothetical protein WA577_004269 [Blastocystis sp. JDR]